MLDETNKRGTPNHTLTENLATCDPIKRQELVNTDETATEENNQILEINSTTTGIGFSSLTPKNLFNLDSMSEEQEPG